MNKQDFAMIPLTVINSIRAALLVFYMIDFIQQNLVGHMIYESGTTFIIYILIWLHKKRKFKHALLIGFQLTMFRTALSGIFEVKYEMEI